MGLLNHIKLITEIEKVTKKKMNISHFTINFGKEN